MRYKIATLAALAVAAAAAPAQAEELRLEARGGVLFNGGSEEATVGGAIGFDGEGAGPVFLGAELSVDKILQDGTDLVVGASGRIGYAMNETAKIYATGGWASSPCDRFCSDSWTAGAGTQFALGGNLYAKAEYRHFFPTDGAFSEADAVVVGLGVQF